MDLTASHRLDARGHLCPVPILMTEEKILELKSGDVLELAFTDPGAEPDLTAWCKATGNEVLKSDRPEGKYRFYIRRRS